MSYPKLYFLPTKSIWSLSRTAYFSSAVLDKLHDFLCRWYFLCKAGANEVSGEYFVRTCVCLCGIWGEKLNLGRGGWIWSRFRRAWVRRKYHFGGVGRWVGVFGGKLRKARGKCVF